MTDVVRGSLIFEDEQSICFFLANVINKPGGVICQADSPGDTMCKGLGLSKVSVRFAKNRFDRDAEGMRDYLVNIHMQKSDDKAGHVAELQIHHRRQVEAKHVFHCVYSYVRKIQEARMMMHIDPKNIFCDEDKCKEYWIDTKVDKYNKKKDITEQKSPLDTMYEKWIGENNIPGQVIWNNVIKPRLVDPKCGPDNCKIKTRNVCSVVDHMDELNIFTELADEMTKSYDMATLPVTGDESIQPMFQGEKCTCVESVCTQSCPEKVKCKCSQRATLQFEADTKDCTTNSC